MLKVANILGWYETWLSFCVGYKHFWRWRQAHLVLKTNEVIVFDTGDKVAFLALEANAFSAKDGMHLTLKTSVLDARGELHM